MLRIDPWCCYFAAVLILVIPMDWLAAAVCAAAFHEGCHIAAIVLLGGKIHQIRLSPLGTALEVSFPDTLTEMWATIAGPLGSFSLILLCHVWPKAALCAFVQGLFNLLPVYPLDGGRILRCLLILLRNAILRKFPCKGSPNRVQ